MIHYPEKVVIAVAPVAHVGTEIPSGVKNPLHPEEIAEDVIDCVRAGASVVHLHVRDTSGQIVFDLGVFTKTLDLIMRETDFILNGSTGGLSSLTLEERCIAVKEPRTQIASLNMGSVNFGENAYVNTVPDIRYWATEMKKYDVMPELEIFDLSMLATAERLVRKGLLEQPLHCNLVLGFEGALPADPRHIYQFVSLLPEGAHWSLSHEGMQDFRLMATALGLGAVQVRTGFEDGFHSAPGRLAKSNSEMVSRLADLVRQLGFEVATPAEARRILGVKKSSIS